MPLFTVSFRTESINTANFTTAVTYMEKKSPFLILITFRTEYKSHSSTVHSSLLWKPLHCTEISKQEDISYHKKKISDLNTVTDLCQRGKGNY